MDALVANGEITESVVAQIGNGAYEPKHIAFSRFLDKAGFEDRLRNSAFIVSHAGIGTIATALRFGRPLLAVPRLKKFGEHVNDHQIPTAQKYERLGHLLVAYETNQIAAKLVQLRTFAPTRRSVNARGVAERIAAFLVSGH